MKRLYALLVILCLFNSSPKAQFVDVGAVFESLIQPMFPSCFNASGQMDTTCIEITSLERLDISNLEHNMPFDLNGIQYFDNLQFLDCSDNCINDLTYLPPILDTLICSGQMYSGLFHWTTLLSLPTLPASLRYLDCTRNGIVNITSLPTALTWLDCSNNYYHLSTGAILPTIESLPELPASLKYLKCDGNRLTSLPELPCGLEYLNCGYNRCYQYDGFTIWFFPGIASIPALPCSLQYLDISYNNLTEVPTLPPSLSYLNCWDDSLLNCLPQLPLSMSGNSPYNTNPYNLSTTGTNINCLPNDVPGMISYVALPVCNIGNNTNGCAIGVVPAFGAGPSINGLTTVSGIPSGSVPYCLFGYNLNPSAGNITVTPSANLEVSTDNINFSTSLLIAYTGGQLPSTQVYVRISSSAPIGTVSGAITNSGGGTANIIVPVNGEVTGAYIAAGPSISGLSSTTGYPSPSTSYSLWAQGLNPSSGNITVTASSTSFEVSTDNINFSTSVSVSYTNGALAPMHIYIRISDLAPAGNLAGTIIHSGGGVTDAIVTVSGIAHNASISLWYSNVTYQETTLGVASSSQEYNLYFLYLQPAAGNVTITASAGLEVSTDNISFSQNTTFAYTGGGGPFGYRFWVRISSSAPAGPVTGTVTHSGGSAADYILPVNGFVHHTSITAGPDISGLSTTSGTASASASYILSAQDLIPVSGNVTVTASAFFEVSTDNTNFSSSLSFPYIGGVVASVPVYVRISNSAPVGVVNGTITNSGGGATSAIVNVSGNVSVAPVPVISAGPDISGLSTQSGTASASASYNLSGADLNPSAGNITVTASASFEVSIDNTNFSSSLSVPYTGGLLVSVPIYVRISSSAAVGVVNGTITNSGGGATNVLVSVSGTVSAAPTPVITATPDNISGLTSTGGNPSAPGTYDLSGSDLIPASGNITVAASNFLELSSDNINFSALPLIIPYTAGSLPSTAIYVRMSGGAPSGPYSGTVTNSGGGATDAIVTINGSTARMANVSIGPNPSRNSVTIYLPGNSSKVSVQLANSNGQVVKEFSTDQESVAISIAHLSRGIYTMRIKGGDINEVRTLVIE